MVRFTASVYVVYCYKLLLMYNQKLKKWLQPGGHVKLGELIEDTSVRECLEETGAVIELVKDEHYKPILLDQVTYNTKIGKMLDFQYLGSIIGFDYSKQKDNTISGFFSYDEMIKLGVDKEIINKFKELCPNYNSAHKYKTTQAKLNYVKKSL